MRARLPHARSGLVQLDRFLKRHSLHSQKRIREMIVSGRVRVDGAITKDVQRAISAFSHVCVDDAVLQSKTPYYLMLNKPAGVVSATSHPSHPTVIDCITGDFAAQLHLAGRLDFNSTGLLLLTNDGRWSRKITQPEEKIPKRYWVQTEDKITQEYVECFAAPMYFAYEGLYLQPAELQILTPYTARVTVYEGRYHQIKRMFGFFNNKVLRLHREAVGAIELDANLPTGAFRSLHREEVLSVGAAL